MPIKLVQVSTRDIGMTYRLAVVLCLVMLLVLVPLRVSLVRNQAPGLLGRRSGLGVIRGVNRPQYSSSWSYGGDQRSKKTTKKDDMGSTPTIDLGEGGIQVGAAVDRETYLFGPKDSRKTFKDCGIHEDLCKALGSCDKQYATIIQERSIETILSGKDVVIGAETGSGKTLSYLLPLIHQCMENKEKRNSVHYPTAIIMVPNKALVMQVEGVAEELLQVSISTSEGHRSIP